MREKRILEAQDIEERPTSPEEKLVAAVLFSAIQDLLRPIFKARNTYGDPTHACRMAAAWIRSTEIYPYSFEWCCHVLGFDPKQLRVVIRKKKKRWERLPYTERRKQAAKGSTFLQAIREI